MNALELLQVYLLPVLVAMLMVALPRMSRGNTWFAVTVPEGYPESSQGRAIHRMYLAGIGVTTLLVVAAFTPLWWLLPPQSAARTAYLLAGLGIPLGALATFVMCRNRVLAVGLAGIMQRSATLAPRPRLVEVLPRPLWWHAVPYLTVILAMAWLAIHWEAIPAQWTSPAGGSFSQPESFTVKSPATAFALPLMMLTTLLAIHAIMPLGMVIRRLPGHTLRVLGINRILLQVMTIAAVLAAWNALAVLYGPVWSTGLAGMIVNLTGVVLIVLLPALTAWSNWLVRPGRPDQGDRTPDTAWKLGLFYYNREDPILFVEKRFGLGYTINFARPLSWVIVLGFIAVLTAIYVWSM